MEPTSSEPRAEGGLSARSGDARGVVEIALPDRVYRALATLVESYDYARDLGCDPWDFAVELPSLRRLGVTNGDCRWLAGKRYLEHAVELTMPGEPVRTFRQGGALLFGKRTCFVLTESGERFARKLSREPAAARSGATATAASLSDGAALLIGPAPAGGGAPAGANGDLLEQSLKPVWDRDRQQLRVGKKIVKEFKVPAANQEVILAAFQEEHWPPRVDDPLPPHPDQDPKRRLHDTINSLNRNQKQSLIKFLGDGSGQGVRWEFTSLATSNGA